MPADPHHTLIVFFGQIAVMLSVAVVFGQVMRRFHQPAVLGELLGGVFLGPTILGRLFPQLFAAIFPDGSAATQWRDAVIKMGMLFFLFVAGLEVNLAQVRQRTWSVILAGSLGMGVPFGLGFAAAVWWPDLWGPCARDGGLVFALFMGTALSISALPVIARIFADLGLLRTTLGSVVMSVAAVTDLAAWSLFAAIIAVVERTEHDRSPWTILATMAAFSAAVLLAGRCLARPLLGPARRWLSWPTGFLGLTIAAILLAATAAETIGVHGVFGAFILGVALGRGAQSEDASQAHDAIYQFSISFFVPLYCVSVGLKADFAANFDPILVLVALAIACVGKILAAGLGAWLGGMTRREALAVGFALNARGAMEMILATVALEHGLIDARVFVALVFMALATSMLSGPGLQRLDLAKSQAWGTIKE
jgi:Kef-type K+ transport system membrane component KefB